jgi:hypothetical protein
MASTINAQIAPFTAVVMEADDTGNLALQTANVTALTINSSQVVSLAQPLPVSSGGTGATTQAAAAAAVLPSQTSNSGKYLTTDGANASWATLSAPNNGTLTMATSGTGLSGSATFTADQSGNSTFTVTSNATNANTAGAIVARDGSGNFSAGTITATLSGTASALVTGNSYQVRSLGVGTAASGTTGEIRATNNVTAYFSDERLKTKTGDIENALDKVCQIETMLYHANETAVALGYDASVQEVGVTAQSVQKVQPEIVVPAPIDDRYLTVRYEKLVPLLIEAIKELKAQVVELKGK